MTWTRFMDMHSGGGQKGPADKILIEAPEAEARVIFYNRFGLNPDRVSCTCCGEDYSVSEEESLAEATAYDRNCHTAYFYVDSGERVEGHEPSRWGPRIGEWDRERRAEIYNNREVEQRYVEQGEKSGYAAYRSLDDYLGSDDVLVVRAGDILPEEREGEVPRSGYVWID